MAAPVERRRVNSRAGTSNLTEMQPFFEQTTDFRRFMSTHAIISQKCRNTSLKNGVTSIESVVSAKEWKYFLYSVRSPR